DSDGNIMSQTTVTEQMGNHASGGIDVGSYGTVLTNIHNKQFAQMIGVTIDALGQRVTMNFTQTTTGLFMMNDGLVDPRTTANSVHTMTVTQTGGVDAVGRLAGYQSTQIDTYALGNITYTSQTV